MMDLIWFALIIVLILAVGVRFCLLRSSSVRMKWMGLSLISMALLLMAIAIMQYLSEDAHSYGH
ncbi:multisubunit Na+/H+ antiporter MnhC subunit [Paenibacillus sp. OAS669]|nr:multisubunit Na+/H+ antiporter MnhC subunit [Paenibacillus sp. OAS669]